MLVLFYGAGASSSQKPYIWSTTDRYQDYQRGLEGLLTLRGETLALEIVAKFDWALRCSEIWVGDHYEILHAGAYLEDYELARSYSTSPSHVAAIRAIAGILLELGSNLRYIAISPDQTGKPEPKEAHALNMNEIKRVVNSYIGVTGGYLGNFSYKAHREFYADLDLPLNPDKFVGTTRERFIAILDQATPVQQKRILEGVLDRFPVGSEELRTEQEATEMRSLIARLGATSAVALAPIEATTESVQRTLDDAEICYATTVQSAP